MKLKNVKPKTIVLRGEGRTYVMGDLAYRVGKNDRGVVSMWPFTYQNGQWRSVELGRLYWKEDELVTVLA